MKFEWKFGFGEVIAILALVFSAVSLWQSHEALTQNLPSISVREDRVLAGPFLNPVLKKREHLMYARFVITNLGGRTVTFLGFEQNPRIPLIRGLDTLTTGPDLSAEIPSRFVVLNDFADEIRL